MLTFKTQVQPSLHSLIIICIVKAQGKVGGKLVKMLRGTQKKRQLPVKSQRLILPDFL